MRRPYERGTFDLTFAVCPLTFALTTTDIIVTNASND